MCRNHDVWSTKARWGQRRGRLGAVIVAAVEVSSRRHRIRREKSRGYQSFAAPLPPPGGAVKSLPSRQGRCDGMGSPTTEYPSVADP